MSLSRMSLLVSSRAEVSTPASVEERRLAAVRAGDSVALEQTLVALLPHVRRWLLRLMGPRPDVDDAAQDALIELAKALPRFEGRAKLTTFAHRVTVRVAYRYYKRRPAPGELLERSEPVETRDPEARLMERQALEHLHRALATLPEKRRVAFVLCCVEGLTPSEAARVAGSTALAMRSRLHHARAAVEELLGEDPAVIAFMRSEAAQ
jgi:RNA polymerase sigma-70 factor (ECF subfamily)